MLSYMYNVYMQYVIWEEAEQRTQYIHIRVDGCGSIL